MSKIFHVLIFLLPNYINAQNVGINNTNPHPSAQLDVTSTNKGFLPPRMTFVQRNLISNPAAGLIIYCIDCDSLGQMQYFNGTSWVNMIGGLANGPIPQNLPSVTICNQIWSLKNLSVSIYRNGDTIPKITNMQLWNNLNYGAWCWYNNDSANYSVYGKLYNWYAVNDPRGLAPIGWHIPDNGEWNKLIKCIDPTADTSGSNPVSPIAAKALKDTGSTYWNQNSLSTNSSGFTALPAGACRPDGPPWFSLAGDFTGWWSKTEVLNNSSYAWVWFISSSINSVIRNPNYTKPFGYSIRCVKD